MTSAKASVTSELSGASSQTSLVGDQGTASVTSVGSRVSGSASSAAAAVLTGNPKELPVRMVVGIAAVGLVIML